LNNYRGYGISGIDHITILLTLKRRGNEKGIVAVLEMIDHKFRMIGYHPLDLVLFFIRKDTGGKFCSFSDEEEFISFMMV
jgi:hypothetical protein